MQNQHYPVIVLGLGSMGSCALYELSKAEISCLGIEQFSPVHDKGSSHGQTRNIRKAYFEHPDYVPLLEDAYKLWEKFEKETRTSLLVKTGVIHITEIEHEVYQGCLHSAKKHYVPYEELNHIDLQVRFPTLSFDENRFGLFEPDGGYLWVEKAIELYLQHADPTYATQHFGEKVLHIEKIDHKIHVSTNKNLYTCDQLISTTGAWTNKLLPDVPLEIHRNAFHFFEHPDRKDMPVFFYNTRKGNWFYGQPAIDGKIKVAYHRAKNKCDPDTVNRNVSKEEIEEIQQEAKFYIPELGEHIESKTCLYSMSPDEHFILGKHPSMKNIFVAAGFSGHGFKFTPVVGKELLNLVQTGKTVHNIDFLSPSRFS